MAFIQNKTNRNFSVSQIHKFLRFDSSPQGGLVVFVNSYANLEAFQSPDHLLNWQDSFLLPPAAAANPEAWLISPEGPFTGATMLVEDSPLEIQRSLRWAQLKARRTQLEGQFPYLEKSLQTDAESVGKYSLFATAAAKELDLGHPYVLNWTTLDNSVLEMDAEQVIDLPIKLAEYLNQIHQTGVTLRNQLYDPATDTAEKINAISWPL